MWISVGSRQLSKRITVMLDDEIYKKLRIYQAKQIKNSVTSVSFSSLINSVLDEEIKNLKI